LPAYARNRRGRIVAWHVGWVFPDTNAHGRGETPQHLYTVAFEGAELWGDRAERGVVVHLDLFEPYLEVEDV
jgi:nitrile hydratase